MSVDERGRTASRVAGLEHEAVERWFRRAVPAAVPPLSFELLAGGHSNLTYRVVDRTGRSFVLRRPPVGHVRSGAHSMEREWRILAALQSGNVPVPPTLGFCNDATVTGAEFYVMGHVDGIVIDGAADAAKLTHEGQARISTEAVAALVELHQVDAEVVGRRPDARSQAYVERQLALWLSQVTDGGVVRTPAIVDIHKHLLARMPDQRWTGLTHGDFRLGNMLVTPAGSIQAVIDWELWTVGDPLADLGWLAAWWTLETDDGWSPETTAGFASVGDLAATYQSMTGRDTSDLPYYIGFALWRLACIAEGVHERYAAGMMGHSATPLEVLADKPRKLAEAARAVLG